MLVAIRVFRDSGAMNYVLNAITYLIQLTGMNTEFIGALPVAIMKPLSGSGARGMMLDIFQNQGPDSFVGKLASIFQGSADTTFYIIALYFGSVGIKKIRYALWAGIFADIIGVIIAILIGYVFLSNYLPWLIFMTSFHSLSVTGCTDNRPNLTSAIFDKFVLAFTSDNVTGCFSFS